MTPIELSKQSLEAAGRSLATRGTGAVCIVNFVRYRPDADYAGEATGRELPPCSGREAYLVRYVAAFNEVAANVAAGEKAAPVFLGNVQATLLAPPGTRWDDVAIVEYESFETFRRIVESAEYEAKAAPHRRAALADWMFLATTRMVVPA